MAFKQFQKGGHKQLSYPAVAITKSDQININKKCLETQFKGCEHVELFYDSDSEKIGMKPVKKETAHSYALSKKDGTKFATLSGRAFLRHFGLSSTTKTTHIAEWNSESKMIELDLNKDISLEESVTKEPPLKKKDTKTLGHGKDMEL